MIQRISRHAAVLAATIASVFLVGCASVAVSDDAIEQNTARALGVTPGSFKITDRSDSGVKTTYNVRTSASRQYGCYMTGTVAIMGRVVSDAVCTEMNAAPGRAGAQAPAPAAPAPQCNALLRAAGRC